MSGKQSLVLVALLVLGLAAVAMSAQTDLGSSNLVCDICKYMLTANQDKLPELQAALKKLCDIAESKEDCLKQVNEAFDEISKKSPAEACQQLGFCKEAANLNNLLGL